VLDGRQHVLIPSGTTLVAFALPANQPYPTPIILITLRPKDLAMSNLHAHPGLRLLLDL